MCSERLFCIPVVAVDNIAVAEHIVVVAASCSICYHQSTCRLTCCDDKVDGDSRWLRLLWIVRHIVVWSCVPIQFGAGESFTLCNKRVCIVWAEDKCRLVL